ncbi:uncharacterized protein LOC144639220 isoform X2 [Oculina patagonica]
MQASTLQLFFLIAATQLTIADFSSCIPEEYRGVRREIWRGLNGGWYLTHLTSDPRFPNSPTTVEIIQTFTPPRNDDNFYGQRLQAYFVPPISGNYSFLATCDSECRFYLSTDERPGNKKELIRMDQDHRTGYDQWDRYPLQKSCSQQLEGGKLYYIEALHCNYVDNDHVRIHIKFPGSNTSRPLDKEYLFLYSPGSSVQTTCILLRRCGVTCGGGLETRITTREEFMSGACVKHKGSYKEAPSLHVEAYNVTTSTAMIVWKSLNRTESEVVDFTGYRVSLKSERDASRVRLVNANISSLLFEGLNTFTNYCVTVEPLTALGSNRKEDCYYFITEDDTPDLPPQNITATENTKQSSITVRWKPIPERQQNGKILGYKLTFKTMSAIGQLKKPVEQETDQWPRFETIVHGNVYFVVLRDVRPFTWYCIKMLAFTRKGDGAESSCVFIRTQEGVPSHAPINVTTTALNSTSFSVTWQPVPPDHVNGIVLGYKISLENMDDARQVTTETLNVNQTQIVLRGPSDTSKFCVRVLAFTRTGDGEKSDCIEGWTWSEETLFPKMKAVNHGSPTDITITWDKPRDEVLNQLTHYHVTYETISMAGRPVVNSTQASLNVSAELQLVSLKDLTTYTTYKITVKPVMKGDKVENKKVIFAKTCRCPHLMFANWIPSPPYVIQRRSGSHPRGLIPELLAHMLQESCGTCFNYKTWNISYTVNTTESITDPDTRVKVDFRFPVRAAVGRTTYRGFHSYVPLITVPGVALMTRKSTPAAYARDVGHSVLACWPIFAVSIALAVLTGVIIWFAESESNGEQFFTYHFHKGVVEGIWWSFVTMTTVGYGDRYPKTILGRSIAILWFLTGIVLSSLLVSSITSSMSVRILDRHLNVARGKKVGSLAQFPEYDLLIRFISKAGESSTFPTLERLVNALKYGNVDGILVDLYTANYRGDLFNATWIVVSQIISFDFTSGVVISENAAKLEQHFRDYVGNRSTVVTEILQKTNEGSNKEITDRNTQSNKIPLLDPSTHIYRVTIFVLLAMLCLAVFMGMVYHSWYKGMQKRRYEIQVITRRQRREYMKAKLELQQIVEDFYQRFRSTYRQMRLKHRKQLERFKMAETSSTNGKIPLNHPNGTWV